MRLTDHIHLVGSGSSGLYLTDAFDAHVYLVAGARGSVLIDAGCGRDVDAVVHGIAHTATVAQVGDRRGEVRRDQTRRRRVLTFARWRLRGRVLDARLAPPVAVPMILRTMPMVTTPVVAVTRCGSRPRRG